MKKKNIKIIVVDKRSRISFDYSLKDIIRDQEQNKGSSFKGYTILISKNKTTNTTKIFLFEDIKQ